MMKRRLKPIEYSLLFIPVLVLAGSFILYSQDMRDLWDRQGAHERVSCQTKLEKIGLAFLLYAQDYDGKLPPNRANTPLSFTVGWRNELHEYGKRVGMGINPFKCPTIFTRSGLNPLNATDYWLNGHLVMDKPYRGFIVYPASTLLAGDGAIESDPDYTFKSLPENWKTDQNSPAQRHMGGANYVFLDGHVKWLKPQQISNEPKALYTFTSEIIAVQTKTTSEPR